MLHTSVRLPPLSSRHQGRGAFQNRTSSSNDEEAPLSIFSTIRFPVFRTPASEAIAKIFPNKTPLRNLESKIFTSAAEIAPQKKYLFNNFNEFRFINKIEFKTKTTEKKPCVFLIRKFESTLFIAAHDETQLKNTSSIDGRPISHVRFFSTSWEWHLLAEDQYTDILTALNPCQKEGNSRNNSTGSFLEIISDLNGFNLD